MQIGRLPELVIASDWSKNEEKRWMVRAELIDQENYLVSPPEPVGVPETLICRLKNQVTADNSVLRSVLIFQSGCPLITLGRPEFPTFE